MRAICASDFLGLLTALAALAPSVRGFADEPNPPSCVEGGNPGHIAGKPRCINTLEAFKDCPACPEMVALPVGTFEMGSPDDEQGRSSDESPRRVVKIGALIAVAKYETIFAEWDACVADGACTHRPRDSWGRGRRPVINVSWDDIRREFLPWLSRKTGHTYRLLTEAEWEYAARAGSTSAFSSGPAISTAEANFDGTSTYAGSKPGDYRKRTLEVGSFRCKSLRSP